MAISINTAARNTMLNALADTMDAGVCTLNIRSGTAPAVTAAETGTLLASITLPTPAFGASATGIVTLAGTWQDASADATGTASYFRITTDSGEAIQGSVTATGGGGDLELSTVDLTVGGDVTISAGGTLTMPAS